MSESYKPVGICVAGLGAVANSTYLPGLADYADKVRLVSVCDNVPGVAEKTAAQYNAEKSHEDLNDALSDPDVEAVVILTSVASHYTLTMAALEAGKHVYVEKTAAKSIDKLQEMIDEAKKRNLVLACAPAIVASPMIQKMIEMKGNGDLGRVSLARAETSSRGVHWNPNATSDQSWFYGPEVGPLRDRGIYLLHILIGLLGPVKRVSAFHGIAIPERTFLGGPSKGKAIKTESPDNSQLLLDFGDAVYAHLSSTFCISRGKSTAMDIWGDQGHLIVDLKMKEPQIVFYSAKTETETAVDVAPWALSDGVENFLDTIRTGAPLGYPPEHSLHVLEVMEKSFQSAEEGRVIDIDSTF